MAEDEFTANRRELGKLAVAIAGVAAVAPWSGRAAAQAPKQARRKTSQISRSGKPNILFVFTDQERYRAKLPNGYSLPGHERLHERGVSFHNHHCPATMCTSSRSVMMTGLTTVDNGMFENCDMPYVGNLSTKIPTIGHMLKKLGYYTAYKGKWHLNKDFDNNDEVLLTKEMEKYGFADSSIQAILSGTHSAAIRTIISSPVARSHGFGSVAKSCRMSASPGRFSSVSSILTTSCISTPTDPAKACRIREI